METIFTTKQQLYYADKARYTKQYANSLSNRRSPTLDDILELPITKRSPRWSYVIVDSPEGFGEPHTIKLHRSRDWGMPCEGVYYSTKEACIKDMLALYLHKAYFGLEAIREALNLPIEDHSVSIIDKHPVRYDLLDAAVSDALAPVQKIVSVFGPLQDQYEQEAEKRREAWNLEYDKATKGTPEELASEGYIYLDVEADDGEVVCFRASKRGSGFYYELLEVFDYTVNWYRVPVRVAEQIKHRNDWCTAMDPFWRELVYQRHEQVF